MSSRAVVAGAMSILLFFLVPAMLVHICLPSHGAAVASQSGLAGSALSTYVCARGHGLDSNASATQQRCRSLEVKTDKAGYRLGENVRITLHFIHLLPGCAEIQVIHTHQIRLVVRNSNSVQVEAWQWQADRDMTETVTWKPSEANTYVVMATLGPSEESEIEDQATIQVTSDEPALLGPGIQWFLYGVTACVLVGGFAAYLWFRSKPGKGETSTSQGMPNVMSRSCVVARLSTYRTAQ